MDTVCAFGDMYHKSGMRIRIAFPLAMAEKNVWTVNTADDLAAQVDAYLAAGFAVREPGAEPGEKKDVCSLALRTTVSGQNGDCPRVYLYSSHDGVKHPIGNKYLNTPADIAEFEKHSGLVVDRMPEWPAGQAPAKGTGKDKYIVRCPKEFEFSMIPNPRYDETKAKAAAEAKLTNPNAPPYTVPAKVFGRYGGQGSAVASLQPATKVENAPQTANTGPQGANADDAVVNGFETELENCQSLPDLGRIGLDIKNHTGLSDGGRVYLRGVYDGRKKYLEAAASNDSIPW